MFCPTSGYQLEMSGSLWEDAAWQARESNWEGKSKGGKGAQETAEGAEIEMKDKDIILVLLFLTESEYPALSLLGVFLLQFMIDTEVHNTRLGIALRKELWKEFRKLWIIWF